MRGRICARRYRLGLETACHNGRPPARFHTPRYCRLWHGNMDIHIPAVCLHFFCYCTRSLCHILVHGYAPLPRLSGLQWLRLGCVSVVRTLAQVLSCVPLDWPLLFLHPSHSLRLARAAFVSFVGFQCALLARSLLPLPRRPCHVFASAWHAFVVWHASCVCTCYIAVDRSVPCAFLPKEKSVFATPGVCKQRMSSVLFVGTLCTHAVHTESAATAPCWSFFHPDVAHRDHMFLFLYMSSTRGKMCSSLFGASLGTLRGPANSSTQSIAKAVHARHGERRILCIFFCHRCVSIGLRYIHFCVFGRSTPHTLSPPHTLIAVLPNRSLLLAKLSKVNPKVWIFPLSL